MHVEYDNGTFGDIEAVEPAHVAISDALPGEPPTDYVVISILPAPGRPPAVSGTAIDREQQREVERWLENSPWYRAAGR